MKRRQRKKNFKNWMTRRDAYNKLMRHMYKSLQKVQKETPWVTACHIPIINNCVSFAKLADTLENNTNE